MAGESIIITAFTNILLQKLPALLLEEEAKLGKELQRDIKFLTENLQIIQDSVSGAEHPVVDSKFLDEAKDLSCDIEDCIDNLTLVMEREQALTPRRRKGFVDRTMEAVKKTSTRHQIANKLHALRSRVMAMSRKVVELRRTHQSNKTVSTISSVTSVEPHHLLDLHADASSSLIGVDGPRDELVKLLMEKNSESAADERLKVVSIVGFGGLGKTTLAKVVYSTTKQHFECKAWVSVSRNPNMKKLLIDILCQVENRHSSAEDGQRDERDLIRNIKASLQHKRYLLAVDDIWNLETWEIIKSCLALNNVGSRVIITTRINNVAKSCSSHWNDYIYNIKPLSEMDSKKLFLRRIFGSAENCPQHLVDLSDKILNKCSGFPLAIIVVSSFLVNKKRSFTMLWEDVYSSIIGVTLESMEGMRNIFLLSYFDLPDHLKICLLYLSVFPEDYIISRDRVVRRWIAEGFILENKGKTLEEVGESYFNELINRYMIQPLYGSYDGKSEVYKIHDIMLDIIRSKSVEENFVTLLDSGLPLPVLRRKIRWLSIIDIKEDHSILETMNTSHIRSLSVFENVGPKLSFEHFTFLRVLDLEGCKDLKQQNVEDIAKLIHLRYLSIRDTPISKLPEQIGRLQYLTTLDLQGSDVEEFPMSIVQLQRLAHLLCDKMRFPEWIGKLTSLSCLSQFDILQSNIHAVEELGNLSELRELVIWWLPDTESNNTETYEHIVFSLYRLKKLQSLHIHGGDRSVDFFDHLRHPLRQLRLIKVNRSCYLNRIPEWFRSLPSLAYVCLDVAEVKNEDLQLLSELPLLSHLSLSSKAMPTEKLVVSSNGFPVLQELHLQSVRANLIFEPHAMQKLEKLLLLIHVVPEEAYSFSISIDQFRCLKTMEIRIDGKGVDASKLFEDANVALRNAAKEHQNHPTMSIMPLGDLIDYSVKVGKENKKTHEDE